MDKIIIVGWKEIEAFVGFSKNTIKKLVVKGFPLYRLKPKGSVYINPEEVKKWLIKK